MGGGVLGGRGWAAVEVPVVLSGNAGVLKARVGSTVGDRLPQLDFRLGGPATVRGYTYGVARGRAFWALQAEVAVGGNEWAVPVVFADAGGLFDDRAPLLAVGAGASLLKGWMRIDFAKSLTKAEPLRVDITFRAPR